MRFNMIFAEEKGVQIFLITKVMQKILYSLRNLAILFSQNEYQPKDGVEEG